MDTITELASDERRARIALACMTEPGDAVTGRMVRTAGAVETIGLLDSHEALPGLSPVEAGLWRKRMTARADAATIRSVMDGTNTRQSDVLMPGDEAWPVGVGALGDRAPLLLWAKGDAGLLTVSLPGVVTITGARAATAYGEQVTSMLAGALADQGQVIMEGPMAPEDEHTMSSMSNDVTATPAVRPVAPTPASSAWPPSAC